MKYTIKQFKKDFPNDDVCLDYLFKTRFPHLKGYSREYKTKRYTHSKGFKHVYPMVGTIFEGSSTPLSLWFYGIYLFSVSKNGVSSKELQRHLGVSYNTSWRMCKKIRELMKSDSHKLTGVIEVDETFISKTPVLGVIERGGHVRVKVVPKSNGISVVSHVIKNVGTDSLLNTDGNRSYLYLDRMYDRDSVNHSSKQYVKNNTHINSMEGFWSQVKRSIHGTHHSVTPKHLQSYLDFFSFQHVYRTSEIPLFWVLLGRVSQ